MKLKNKIINYFVARPLNGALPRVFLSPVTINHATAHKLLSEQLKKQGKQPPTRELLHVCFDMESELVYILNPEFFTDEEKQYMLGAARTRISKDFGGSKNFPPIEGSPFSSVRIRSISSFGYSKASAIKHFGQHSFVDLPVIEANLEKMPHTVSKLPAIFKDPNFAGGYIGPKDAPHIDFFDELDNKGRKRPKPAFLFRHETPFILIDNSAKKKLDQSNKEFAVLLGYRDFVADLASSGGENFASEEKIEDATNFADLYAARHFLEQGYPFEEVCSVMLPAAKNVQQLCSGIDRLMQAADALEQEGYANPARIPYYITFKTDYSTFPIDLNSLSSDGETFNAERQLASLTVIEYDKETGYILLTSPAFISPDLCMKIFRPKSRPLVTHYNHAVKKIDVKSSSQIYSEYKTQGEQLAKIKALSSHDLKEIHKDPAEAPKTLEFRTDKRAQGVSMSNSEVCNLRKVSDFYYACAFIKKICKKRNVPFVDLEVVIGPLEKIFGPGINGGFMDKESFVKSKMTIPHEIEKGLFVNPPLIALDSVNMPGYDAQTSTLIHEYCHNLFSITDPSWKHVYNTPEAQKRKKKDNNWYWYTYLTDPDERQAHTEQIKHELISGLTPDEIIRDKVGGAITTENYPIALKFKELVDECVAAIEQEEIKNEKPVGEHS